MTYPQNITFGKNARVRRARCADLHCRDYRCGQARPPAALVALVVFLDSFERVLNDGFDNASHSSGALFKLYLS